MNSRLNTSSEFASLVNKLHKEPNNQLLKLELVQRMSAMKTLAQHNSMDLFRLANAYSPNSPQYKQLMRQAAAGGNTNAMLAMCHLLLKSNTAADLTTLAHYVRMILRSKDSYIMEQIEHVLGSDSRLVNDPIKKVDNVASYNANICFFTRQQEQESEQTVALKNNAAMN